MSCVSRLLPWESEGSLWNAVEKLQIFIKCVGHGLLNFFFFSVKAKLMQNTPAVVFFVCYTHYWYRAWTGPESQILFKTL